MRPVVSILVTTYNRVDLLRRCLDSIFDQTFTDFELIVIDDASTDGTKDFLDFIPDKRLHYIRNEQNQASKYGDRVHIQRFVNSLSKGNYIIYLCDDDMWTTPSFLARAAAMMEKTTAMVIGGQLSDYGSKQEFHDGIYPKTYMSSSDFLRHFSETPIECNINVGATLYNKEIFLKSGAMQEEGSRWQAGYELYIGPGCFGEVIYINEPMLKVAISKDNASFRGTQLSHYQDSIKSVMTAFKKPLEYYKNSPRHKFLVDSQSLILHNIGQSYLRNAEQIAQCGELTMCSPENISTPVTENDIVIA